MLLQRKSRKYKLIWDGSFDCKRIEELKINTLKYLPQSWINLSKKYQILMSPDYLNREIT